MTYPDYIREKAREMRARKMTLDEISERLAIGKPTVWSWINDMPKPPQTPRQKAARLRAAKTVTEKHRLIREAAYQSGTKSSPS